MKKLLLVRHANTKQPDFGERDFDRELLPRGEKEAPLMAKLVKDKGITIDAYISSPSMRTRQTANAWCKVFGDDKSGVIYFDYLYHAGINEYYKALETLNKKVETVAIFGHNFGITDFADQLCEEVHIDQMPTGSVFAVNVPIEKWKDVREAKNKFAFFETPKENR